jgi:hypothetical protein
MTRVLRWWWWRHRQRRVRIALDVFRPDDRPAVIILGLGEGH